MKKGIMFLFCISLLGSLTLHSGIVLTTLRKKGLKQWDGKYQLGKDVYIVLGDQVKKGFIINKITKPGEDKVLYSIRFPNSEVVMFVTQDQIKVKKNT